MPHMGSKWTRDFVTGVFGIKVPDEEWAAHDAAHRPKLRPVKRRIHYDNAGRCPGSHRRVPVPPLFRDWVPPMPRRFNKVLGFPKCAPGRGAPVRKGFRRRATQ
jgi:hypothetical protein